MLSDAQDTLAKAHLFTLHLLVVNKNRAVFE